jgi:NAD(P)-dependent dehydrogenase (short-subunit alcohol dehydrogenase family)
MAESEPVDDAGATGTTRERPVSVRDTAVVTGAGSGIGRATATALHEEGYAVYATARNPDDVDDLAAAGFEAARLDVTDGAQARDIVDRAVDETGTVDLVVNAAGYAQLGPIEDVPTSRVRRQFDVNVFGPHRVIQATLPHMRAAGEGTVVNVASVAGRVPFPGGGVYSGAEHALVAMTGALRAEVSGLGIDVVVVESGPVRTEFARRADRELRAIDRTEDYGPFYRFYDDTQTIGGLGAALQPEDVAEVIVEAAVDPNPDDRYAVGGLARFAGVVSRLPARWRDRVYGLLRRVTA